MNGVEFCRALEHDLGRAPTSIVVMTASTRAPHFQAICRADDALGKLRREVEGGEGWLDLETEDGTLALQLSKVVFVRIAGAPHTIGFSGT